MNDSDLTLHSDDSENDLVFIAPKRTRPAASELLRNTNDSDALKMSLNNSQSVGTEARLSSNKMGSQDADISRIVSSLYAFTYKYTPGSLLTTRLAAMQRSLMFSHEIAKAEPEEQLDLTLLKALHDTTNKHTHQHRLSIPLDDHDRQTPEEMLEYLTVPYMDISPEDHSASRPPSMLRRASSMVLKSTQLYYSRASSKDFKGSNSGISGIATPLQHQPTKGSPGPAFITTNIAVPFKIKTLNDISCLFLGLSKQEAQNRSLLEFVSPNLREWLASKVNSTPSRVRLDGYLLELHNVLVSLWVESPSADVLVWMIGEVPSTRLDMPIATDSKWKTSLASKGIHRVIVNDSSVRSENVVLQGGGCLWSPTAIGSTVIVDSMTLQIQNYNKPSMSAMLGVEGDQLIGKSINDVVPQFNTFWSKVSHFCVSAGVVIPEHAFRRLAGIPFTSSHFTSPTPSRVPGQSITATNGEFSCFIDLQLRLLGSNVLVVWLSYSHLDVETHTQDLLPKIESVTSATPHLTPKRTPQLTTPMLTPILTPREPRPVSPASAFAIVTPSAAATSNAAADVLNAATAAASNERDEMKEILDVHVGAKRRELKIESFDALQKLGHGAYGEVKLVRTPSKKHVVVVKSIYKDRILVDTWSRSRELGTIPNEIRILNQLRQSSHPHIVTMIDFFEDSQCYHMEMLPCGNPRAMDLFDYIERHNETVSPAKLLQIWQQVVSAVAHIHSLGIVHRDIKDENIVMDEYCTAQLIDFGSTAYVSQGPFDVFVGTVDYAAPEIIRGELYSGPPQDVWALGILLYIMLFKHTPFKDAKAIVSAGLPLHSPSLGDTFFRSTLQKSPENRPEASQILEMLP